MTDTFSPPTPARLTRESVLSDYALGWRSRHASLIGRREVLTGKAKFGIFGDGKEVAQLAMARAFRPGDIRSGYYRDQTFMMAVGALDLDQFFAQLYADADPDREPASAGRQMNAHFASRLRGPDGAWLDLTAAPQSIADLSPTAGQMPRLVGLGLASRLYRELPELAGFTGFSRGGDEIAFGTIGNASCAEGHFWETLNAVGVLRAPVLISIWDDGYGISVPSEFQIAKADLSEILDGFRRRPGSDEGIELVRVAGWDYPALVDAYLATAERVRRDHRPAVVHVADLTQPQGHSTSGSHERYKSKERLAWEEAHDGLRRMRQWLLAEGIAGEAELAAIEAEAAQAARAAQRRAWDAFQAPILEEERRFVSLASALAGAGRAGAEIDAILAALGRHVPMLRRHVLAAAHEVLIATAGDRGPARAALLDWMRANERENRRALLLRTSTRRAPARRSPWRRWRPTGGRTRRASTASKCCTPASTRRSRGCPTWSPSARTSAISATSTRPSPACRRSTARCASRTPGSARRRSWGRPSASRCAACARSPRSSTSTTSSTPCRLSPTTSPRCATGRVAARRRRSSSARAATGWRGSGTPARRWARCSTCCAECGSASRAT